MFETSTDGRDARRSSQKYYGKYPGVVIENTPPEDATHRGELLVQVPGILEETEDGSGQQPIQVVAKPCFHPGFFFVPEAEAQVWVEFVAGDINDPIWTGVWYPTDASPQTADEEAPTEFQKIIRTASGHVIQLDDTDGEEKIIVWHKQASFISIDKDGHVLIEHKDGMTIEIKDDKVTITADVVLDGEVQITGNTTIEGDLTVGSGPSTTISGNEITGG
jgi:hypothetical protein